MAERIAKQFATHGETVDGVKVANTEQWTDPVAVRAYRAAMNKDVDSIIVQKSSPTCRCSPTRRPERRCCSSSRSRSPRIKVLLRGLQEDQAGSSAAWSP
jgi:hypothetical protein